ncbi:M20 family metallopeptidase [Vibrio alginolyticus]|uniref:M20 aminoacylase family protein n=1 Tax=Vibrio TaxID=662 RepID=UPI000CE9A3E4|nr:MULTISPECIES: M20 aminoacylase family protein [Vibrio]MDW2297427.1 M20 aminoacylase family protein [Vibrio sp. 1404]AVF75661.1 amidohydrolase [Vibrio alginolyticus]EIJ2378723.1 amidohydrolase [Vibrio alginolyticus]EKA3120485.1 amidohydrolase [Vibrio alginolyticus]ELC9522688.1 amidohydrolase [Vibrio alginolyticus]
MNIIEVLEPWLADAISIRHAIHKQPELGFEENNTQALVVAELEKYGVDEICTDFAKTGVVGVIHGSIGDGKSIGLRADMDALPIHEANTFAHRSCRDGKMHACGHDGHTTMLLLAARYLARSRNFAGKAVLIFQPAEEGRGGAETMITDGVLERFPIDECYALHNMPGIPEGHFAFKTGPIMASSDRLFVTVDGKSGHAGLPHTTQDPLLVATHIYQGIQGMVSRNYDPFDPLVVSVTQLHCGETTNAIADQAHMSGTFRTLSQQTRDSLVERLEQLVAHSAKAHGMQAEFKLGPISHPPTVNTENETRRAIDAAAQTVGAERVNPSCEAMLTSEDFAFFLNKVPGCYGFIGNGTEEQGCSVGLHNKAYDFNDRLLPIGAAYFINLIEQQ